MAVSLDSLTVSILADNKNIVSKLDIADRRLQAFERAAVGRISRIESTFGKLGAGLSKGMAVVVSGLAPTNSETTHGLSLPHLYSR